MSKIKDFWRWFVSSNHLYHLLGGLVIGVLANDWYCEVYSTTIGAGCLEFKDSKNGREWQNWDWADFSFTEVGGVLGYLLRILVFNIF